MKGDDKMFKKDCSGKYLYIRDDLYKQLEYLKIETRLDIYKLVEIALLYFLKNKNKILKEFNVKEEE